MVRLYYYCIESNKRTFYDDRSLTLILFVRNSDSVISQGNAIKSDGLAGLTVHASTFKNKDGDRSNAVVAYKGMLQ